jgi:hypothetical protein
MDVGAGDRHVQRHLKRPIDNPVAAAWIYSIALTIIGWIIAQRRYKARTTD